MTIKLLLFTILVALSAAFAGRWIYGALARTRPKSRNGSENAVPTPLQGAIGFGTNFFDTLGIGSFAPTTSMFKLWKMVPDEWIPGTLNVGHTLPVVAQAFIFIAVISVDEVTLLLMIAVAVVGGWLGATVVSGLPRRPIQIGMGVALIVAALFMLMTNLGLFPAGGNALSLGGVRLAIGLIVNFALGSLVALGIGNYAPCLVLISLLGMDPRAAFPIMMGSAAFLMPVASYKFVQRDRYHLQAALGLTLGGIPAVLIAGLIVKSLPLEAVRWLVVVVVLYAAVAMLRSAQRTTLLSAETA